MSLRILMESPDWPMRPKGWQFAGEVPHYFRDIYMLDCQFSDMSIFDKPRSECTEDEIDYQREPITGFLERAFYDVGRAAYAGEIGCVCRDKRGGPLMPVPADWWGIDDFWPRMTKCALNPLAPFDGDAEATHWIFFDERNLAWVSDDARLQYGLKPRWQRRFTQLVDRTEWPGPSKAEAAQREAAANSVPSPADAKGKGGRKPSPHWPLFAAALAEWVEQTADTPEGYVAMGADTILAEVQDLLADRIVGGVPRSTFQPAIQEFVDRMTAKSVR